MSNRAIIETLERTPGFEVRNLDVLYPDGRIDVAAEQQALVEADVVIFQHPVFWFGLPYMLKRWQEEVLTYGFAYGTGGDKLHGKPFLHSCTTGSGADVYGAELTEVILASTRQSALFCGMKYLDPMPAFGHLAMTNPDAAERARQHAERIVATVQALA